MAEFVKFLGIELNEVSVKEKAVSAIGGFVAILVLVFLTRSVLDLNGADMLNASMGASAVLLFTVPHGPLSQPWPVIGGHVLSALIGVTAWRIIGNFELAAAVAVGASIGAMHILGCIHPPGGATALSAVVGGANVHALGYGFVARRDGPADVPGWSHDDVLASLRSIDSFVDIDE